VALTVVTFSLYAYYWLYRTTDELRAESGRDDLHPVLDVVLAALTFGLWGLWAAFRNARVAHEIFEQDGVKHTDRSLPFAIFAALSMVSGWAWLVSMAILQEDLNQLADHLDALDHAGSSERTGRSPAQARVDIDPPEAPPAETASRWEQAPSAPVFESSAPAPIVF
jgi:hypothetical protein